MVVPLLDHMESMSACCSVLQYVAVYCSVLHVLQYVAVCRSVLQCVRDLNGCDSTRPHGEYAGNVSVLQCAAV